MLEPADTQPAAVIDPGQTYTLRHVVVASDSPRSFRLEPEDDYPDVLSTSRAIALLEAAAARILRPLLLPGELSVGVGVHIEHSAPTPLFSPVSAHARYIGKEGRLYAFEVRLDDPQGCAMQGTHTRAVIDTQRLAKTAQRRGAQGSGVHG